MKVGLLTHHWPANFGANLQAFSTVRALESLGHEVQVLNYRPCQMVERYELLVATEQLELHEAFLRSYMKQTEAYSTQAELNAIVQNLGLDCVICGSDAVLRLQANSDREDLSFPNPFWLQWAGAGVRTGFLAASTMGSQFFQLPKVTRKAVRDAVMSLDYCSVRDNWSRWMLRCCGVPLSKVQHCPDPVTGIHAELAGIDTSRPDDGREPYILMSLYDGMRSESWVVEFVAEANRRGFQVYGFPQPDIETIGPFDRVLRLPMSPLDWYRWIANASGYVGVRFHPIMLSQVNQVPYVALDEYDVGLRFSGRYAAGLARRLRSRTRFVSKTFDACARVSMQQYCIPPRDYEQYRPVSILDLLDAARKEQIDTAGVCQARFMETLKLITGDEI